MTDPLNALTSEVVDAYQRYLEAFISDDMEAINALVSYPLAYIGEGKVTMFNEFPIRPSALREKTGWSDTRDVQYKVVGISETKAHLILESGTRVRLDGSPIEHIHAFYAWNKTADGWKMFAVSDVCVAAV
jgi:hypothetical protein